ncbi:3336_t:CDS:2 [Entrophospora sp. SA101]|nr:3336_t:CDS:2 [Entrophospora sp. SA101]
METRSLRTKNNKNIKFDYSTVRTNYKYHDDIKSTRLYNLPEGKTYYPTWKEFKDPYKYITSISNEGKNYGIIKIIPPEGWIPGCSLDIETFKFKTRIQKVNMMEGETRAKLNYIEQLQLFHDQQGRPFTKLPQLDKTPIDLHKLARAVYDRGGPLEVIGKNKQWAEVAREIKEGGYSKTCTSASKTVKERYYEFIEPYERYVANSKQEHLKPNRNQFDIDDENELMDKNQVHNTCEECGNTSSEIDGLLHCSGDCNKYYHPECLKIKRTTLHKNSKWYCPTCLLMTGIEFGFEAGEEFTLGEFQKLADKFEEDYLEEYPLPPGISIEDYIESEFWRLAHKVDDDTEVYYGADVNSTDYGSERDLNNSYKNCVWNLKNLPRLPGSLLHHITPAIPGMMLPWVYVGMIFSAFCWHVEDHYTYSINYMHWGATKTWYGIPSSNASKFELAAKKLLPELFQHQPDLLTQLTTILNPKKLVEEGIEVYAIDQRPNQFIVTFPQAYHSGFNQGLNLNEAVNFALPDWIGYGYDSVKFYKDIKRLPVFSHEKLLLQIGIANLSNYGTMKWLKEPLTEICREEIKLRHEVTTKLAISQQPIFCAQDPNDDIEMQCAYCNGFSYLSSLHFKCSKKILCLEHAVQFSSKICKCYDKPCHFLQLMVLDFHLNELIIAMQKTVQDAMNDMMMINNYIEEVEKPHIHVLEYIDYRIKEGGLDIEIQDLSSYIKVSNDWSQCVKLLCHEIAQRIWLLNYHKVPFIKFNYQEFIQKWLELIRYVYLANNEDKPPLNERHYCFCRNPDDFNMMIQCDRCKEWYHCACVNLNKDEIQNFDTWFCAICQVGIEPVMMKISNTINVTTALCKAAEEFPFVPQNYEELKEISTKINSLTGDSYFHLRRLVGLGLGVAVDGSDTIIN